MSSRFSVSVPVPDKESLIMELWELRDKLPRDAAIKDVATARSQPPCFIVTFESAGVDELLEDYGITERSFPIADLRKAPKPRQSQLEETAQGFDITAPATEDFHDK